MTRSRPLDVETLACAAAGEYAGRWARAVARIQPPGERGAAPWLVDGFAGADLQRAALRGASVVPPAAALARAAEQALGGEARIVLVEEDPGLLARVEDELRGGGAGDRLRRTGDPSSTEPGEITLVEAPLASVVDRLADAVGDDAALVRLAPLGARALPWIVLEPLAMLSGADLLIRLPQEDFIRIGRFAGPLADFPPHLRRVAESCSAMFADPRHGWLLAWREAARASGEDAALAGAIDRLRTMLSDAGEDRGVRAARVDAAGAAVHLLLSTPHAEHALELNGAITDAGAPPPAATPASKRAKSAKSSAAAAPPPPAAAPTDAAKPSAASSANASPGAPPAEASPATPTVDAPSAEASPDSVPADVAPASSPDVPVADAPSSDAPAAPAADTHPPETEAAPPKPKPKRPAAKPAPPPPSAPDEPPSLLDLFTLPPIDEPMPRGPDLRAIADDLHARHVGQSVPFRDLLMGLADSGLAPEQVRTALGMLKRSGRAAYRSLDADGAEVDFRAEAPAPQPASAPKPRKARKQAPDLLGLFDEPEPADEPAIGDAAPAAGEAEPVIDVPPADAPSALDEPLPGDEMATEDEPAILDAPAATAESASTAKPVDAEAPRPSTAQDPLDGYEPLDIAGLPNEPVAADEPVQSDASSWLDEPMSLADAIFPDEDEPESAASVPPPADNEAPAADTKATAGDADQSVDEAPAPRLGRRRKKDA